MEDPSGGNDDNTRHSSPLSHEWPGDLAWQALVWPALDDGVPIVAICADTMTGDRESCPAAGLSDPAAANETAVLDTALALELMDGDGDTLLMVLPMVRDQLQIDRSEMARAFGENDGGRLKKLCHRLKGSVGQIGALRAQEACAQLEAVAADGDLDAFAERQSMFDIELDALAFAIDRYLAEQHR